MVSFEDTSSNLFFLLSFVLPLRDYIWGMRFIWLVHEFLATQVTSHAHALWISTSPSLTLTCTWITVGFYHSRCLQCIVIKLWRPKTKVWDHLICFILCVSKTSIALPWFSCMKEGPLGGGIFWRKVAKGLQTLSSLRSEKSYCWVIIHQ